MFFGKRRQNDRFQGQYRASSLPYKHLISLIWSCRHDNKYAYNTKWHLSNLKNTKLLLACLLQITQFLHEARRIGGFRISKLLNHIMRLKLIFFIIIEAWSVCCLSQQIRKTANLRITPLLICIFSALVCRWD